VEILPRIDLDDEDAPAPLGEGAAEDGGNGGLSHAAFAGDDEELAAGKGVEEIIEESVRDSHGAGDYIRAELLTSSERY
jgi:hypothetical protein